MVGKKRQLPNPPSNLGSTVSTTASQGTQGLFGSGSGLLSSLTGGNPIQSAGTIVNGLSDPTATVDGLLGSTGLGSIGQVGSNLLGGNVSGLQGVLNGLPMVGGLTGQVGNVGGVVGAATGSLGIPGVSGLTRLLGNGGNGVQGLVNGIPIVGGLGGGSGLQSSLNGLPLVGGVVGGLGNGGLQSTLNGIPIVGGLVGSLANGENAAQQVGQVVNSQSGTTGSLAQQTQQTLQYAAGQGQGQMPSLGSIQGTIQSAPSIVGNLGAGKYLLSTGQILSLPTTGLDHLTGATNGAGHLLGDLTGSGQLGSAVSGLQGQLQHNQQVQQVQQTQQGLPNPLNGVTSSTIQPNGLVQGTLDSGKLVDLNGSLVPLSQAQTILHAAGYDDSALSSLFGTTNLNSDPSTSESTGPSVDSAVVREDGENVNGNKPLDPSFGGNGTVQGDEHLTPAQAFQASDPDYNFNSTIPFNSTDNSTIPADPAEDKSSPVKQDSNPVRRWWNRNRRSRTEDRESLLALDERDEDLLECEEGEEDGMKGKRGYENPYPLYRYRDDDGAFDLIANSMGRVEEVPLSSSAVIPTPTSLPFSIVSSSSIPASSTGSNGLPPSSSPSSAITPTSTSSAVTEDPTIDALGRERKDWQRPTDPTLLTSHSSPSSESQGDDGTLSKLSDGLDKPRKGWTRPPFSSYHPTPTPTPSPTSFPSNSAHRDWDDVSSADWTSTSYSSYVPAPTPTAAPGGSTDADGSVEGYEWDSEGPWGDWVSGNQQAN